MPIDNLAVPPDIIDEEENRRRLEMAAAASSSAAVASPKPENPPAPEEPAPQPPAPTAPTEAQPSPPAPEEPVDPLAGPAGANGEMAFYRLDENEFMQDSWTNTRAHNINEGMGQLYVLGKAAADHPELDAIFKEATGKSIGEALAWIDGNKYDLLARADDPRAADKAAFGREDEFRALQRATDELWTGLGGEIPDWVSDARDGGEVHVGFHKGVGIIRDERDFKEWQEESEARNEKIKQLRGEIGALKQGTDRTILGRMLFRLGKSAEGDNALERQFTDKGAWDDPKKGLGGHSLNELESYLDSPAWNDFTDAEAQQRFQNLAALIDGAHEEYRRGRGVHEALADAFRGGIGQYLVVMPLQAANAIGNAGDMGRGGAYDRRAQDLDNLADLFSSESPQMFSGEDLEAKWGAVSGIGSFLGALLETAGYMAEGTAQMAPQAIMQTGIAMATGGVGSIVSGGAAAGRAVGVRAGQILSMIALNGADVASQLAAERRERGDASLGSLAETALVGVPFSLMDYMGGMARGVRKLAGGTGSLARSSMVATGRGWFADTLRVLGEGVKGGATEALTEGYAQGGVIRLWNEAVHGSFNLVSQGEADHDPAAAWIHMTEEGLAAFGSGGMEGAGAVRTLAAQREELSRASALVVRRFGLVDENGRSLDPDKLLRGDGGHASVLADVFKDLVESGATRSLDSADVIALSKLLVADAARQDLSAKLRDQERIVGALARVPTGAEQADALAKASALAGSYREALLNCAKQKEHFLGMLRGDARRLYDRTRQTYGHQLGMADVVTSYNGGPEVLSAESGVDMSQDEIRLDEIEASTAPTTRIVKGEAEDGGIVMRTFGEEDKAGSQHRIVIREIRDTKTGKSLFEVRNAYDGRLPPDRSNRFSLDDFGGDRTAALNAAVQFGHNLAGWQQALDRANEGQDRFAREYMEKFHPGRELSLVSTPQELLRDIEHKYGGRGNFSAGDLAALVGMANGNGESGLTVRTRDGRSVSFAMRGQNATVGAMLATLDHESVHQDMDTLVRSNMENKALLDELGVDPADGFWADPAHVFQRVRAAVLQMDRDGKGNPLSPEAVRALVSTAEGRRAMDDEEERLAYGTEEVVGQDLSGRPVSRWTHPFRAAKIRALQANNPELYKLLGQSLGAKLGVEGGLGAVSPDVLNDYIYSVSWRDRPRSADDPPAAEPPSPLAGAEPEAVADALNPTHDGKPSSHGAPAFSSREAIDLAVQKADERLDALNADPNADPAQVQAARANLAALQAERDAWDEAHPAEGTKPGEEGTKPGEEGTKPEEQGTKPAEPPPAPSPDGEAPSSPPASKPEPAKPAPAASGAARTVEGDKGRVSLKSPDRAESFDARIAFVDLGSIVYDRSPGFRKGLQNRGEEAGRDRTENAIGLNPDADTLTNAGTMLDEGTPVLSADLQTVAGNTRMRGLVRAAGLGRLGGYLERVRREAERLGVDLSGMETPVMVRILSPEYTEEQQEHIAEVSNRQSKNRVSAENLALDDAKKILSPKPVAGSASMLDLFAPGANGELDAASNRDFMSAFVSQTGDNMLLGKDESGRPVPNGEAVARAQRALVAAALHGEGSDRAATGRLLGFLFGDAGMKRIASGLAAAAPSLVVAFDRNPSFSLREDLRAALSEIEAAKERGESLEAHFAQGEMFPEEGARTGAAAPALVRSIAAAIDERARSGRRVRELLQGYADRIFKPRRGIQPEWLLQAEGEENLFGERSKNTKEGVWDRTVAAEAQDDEGLGLSTFRARNGEAADDETVRLASHEMRQVREDAARKFGNRPASDFKPTERIATVFVEGRVALGKRGTPEPVAEIVYRYLGDGRVAALARLAPQLPQPPAFGAALTPEQREELRRKREETRRIMRSRDRNKSWNWPRVFEPVGGLSYRARNGVSVDEAERLEREGYFPEEIFRRTGWYRDEDQGDEWRYDAGRAAEDGGASTARARNGGVPFGHPAVRQKAGEDGEGGGRPLAQAARSTQRLKPDLSVEANARAFKAWIKGIESAPTPEWLPDGSPKAVFDWFEKNMVGKTYSFDIPGYGHREFKVNPGHIGRLVCDGKNKGVLKKKISGSWIDAVRNGEIKGEDVTGWDYKRATMLPRIPVLLTSFDAVLHEIDRGSDVFIFMKKFKTKSGNTNTIVMKLINDGKSIGPITTHMKDLTLEWMKNKDLVLTEEGEIFGRSANNSASRTPPAGDTAEKNSPAGASNLPQSAPEVKGNPPAASGRARNGSFLSEVLNEMEDREEEISVATVLDEWRRDNENGRKKKAWSHIPAEQYRNALRRFMRDGPELFDFPERTLRGWLETCARNVMELEQTTAILGHSDWDARPAVDAWAEENGASFDEDAFIEWARLPDGSLAKSDYGLSPLFDALRGIPANASAAELLVGLNRVLDVIHFQGDLASMFIDGGRETLSRISNEETASESYAADGGTARARNATAAEAARLDAGPTIRVYRAMQLRDGKLYPPMAGKVDGKWQNPAEIGRWIVADERPDLADEQGRFKLDKGNGSSIKAAYNPYWHTSRSPLNDQFSSAWRRPELVTVEVEVPASELTSGYRAEKAKDAVGEMSWHSGPVSSKLAKAGKERRVILSRYCKVVRIVPDAEVADRAAELLRGTGIAVPANTVTPSLRRELLARGVEVAPTKEVPDVSEPATARARGGGLPTYELNAQNGLPGERMDSRAIIGFRQADILARMRGLVPGYDYQPVTASNEEFVRRGVEIVENDPDAVERIERMLLDGPTRPLSAEEQYVAYVLTMDAEAQQRNAMRLVDNLSNAPAGSVAPGQLVAARALMEAAKQRAVQFAQASQSVGTKLGQALQFRKVAYRWNGLLTFEGLMRDFQQTLEDKAGGWWGGLMQGGAVASAEDVAAIKEMFAKIQAVQQAIEHATNAADAKFGLYDLLRQMKKVEKALLGERRHPFGQRAKAAREKVDMDAIMAKASEIADEVFRLFPPASDRDPLAIANATNIVKKIGDAIIQNGIDRGAALPGAESFARELYERCDRILRPFIRLSVREYSDIYSNYGQVREASRDELFARRTKLNQALRLASQIDDLRRGEAPRRTGQQRIEGTDEQAALEKKLHALLKELDPEAARALERHDEPDEHFVKTPLQIWRDAELRELRMLEAALATGIPIERNALPLRLGEEELELRALVEKRRAEYRAAFETPETDEERIQAYLKILDARKQKLEKELEAAKRGEFKGPRKKDAAVENDPRVKLIRAELAEIRAKIQEEADRRNDPVRSTYAKRVRAAIAAATRRQELAERWLANPAAYFEDAEKRRRRRTQIDEDAAVKEARRAAKEKMDEWTRLRERLAFGKMNKVGKALAVGGGFRDIIKLGLASGDISGIGVQCALACLDDPKAAGKAIRAGVGAFLSEKDAEKTFLEKIKNDPFLFEAMEDYGLKISSFGPDVRPDGSEEGFARGYVARRAQELVQKNLGAAGKALSWYVDASERAFTLPVDILRLNLCRLMAEQAGRNLGRLTAEEKRFIGRMANAATGRGDFFGSNSFSAVLSKVMWAPARFSGQLQMMALPFTLLAHSDVRGGVKLAIAKHLMVRTAVGYAAAALLAWMLRGLVGDDGDDEEPLIEIDPRSSKFGRLNIGGRMFSITGGLESYVTLAARIWTGETKTKHGDVQTLEQQRTGRTDLLWRLLKNKATPDIGLAMQLLDGKAPSGEKIERRWLGENGRLSFVFGNSVFPLTAQDLAKVWLDERTNNAEAFLLTALTIVGYNSTDFGYDDYEAQAHRFDRAHKALKEAATPEERERVFASELGRYAQLDAQGEALRKEYRSLKKRISEERDVDKRAALLALQDANAIKFRALWDEGLREEAANFTPDMEKLLRKAAQQIEDAGPEDEGPPPLNYW